MDFFWRNLCMFYTLRNAPADAYVFVREHIKLKMHINYEHNFKSVL